MSRIENERRFFWLTMMFSLMVLGVFTVAGLIKHEYWRYIIYEKSPYAAYQGLLLFLCFGFALANALFLFKKRGEFNQTWILFSIGFFYLTMDEIFAIHEKIRELILKPGEIQIPWLFWVEKGDYVLLVLMLTGILILPFVLREMQNNSKAWWYFISAVGFSTVAVVIDSIYLEEFSSGIQKLLQYIEVLCETGGMLFFLNSFKIKLLDTITISK
ncbi:MAG TPA: hypothetical protein VEC37_15535 [Bacillota bacterium]|nr:hypothetical protein [Bacillota bacterium]